MAGSVSLTPWLQPGDPDGSDDLVLTVETVKAKRSLSHTGLSRGVNENAEQ